jgi:hypothetical protein
MAKSNEASDTGRPTQEQIANRAYELFLQRGSVSGYELDDWLQAEAELSAAAVKNGRGESQKQASAPSQESEESDGHSNGRRPSARDRSPSRRVVRP